ncbi:SDR family oxidoreductase [Rudaea cellulosilytica]|uniref:SDR family oxidoreductase n=1 Tax=Rudaea cellulosilytica TaxID=540746 RepID=UPI000360F66D|nr:SDR family oxidoreductase [Rudaea cellulosilytica]
MKKILIIGATSAIAEVTARIFAARGEALFLVARNAERLQAIKADLDVRGAVRTATATLDVADVAAQQAIIDQAERELGGLDIVLIAHGTLSDQGECEKSVAALRREFEVNALSTMALLTILANTFEARRTGTLAVISSVAGDRGRQSNYVYGAAKAAVTAFLSGLRQRLAKSNVDVLTIKPGFVDTPMTANVANKGALWAKPDAVAAGIVRAIDKRRNVVYLPGFWALIMLVIKHIPEAIFKKLKL